MLAVDTFTADDPAALTLSQAARRLFASMLGDVVGGSTAAAEAVQPVLQSLRPLLAWLHESLEAVVDAVTGGYGNAAACDRLKIACAGICWRERDAVFAWC